MSVLNLAPPLRMLLGSWSHSWEQKGRNNTSTDFSRNLHGVLQEDRNEKPFCCPTAYDSYFARSHKTNFIDFWNQNSHNPFQIMQVRRLYSFQPWASPHIDNEIMETMSQIEWIQTESGAFHWGSLLVSMESWPTFQRISKHVCWQKLLSIPNGTHHPSRSVFHREDW